MFIATTLKPSRQQLQITLSCCLSLRNIISYETGAMLTFFKAVCDRRGSKDEESERLLELTDINI